MPVVNPISVPADVWRADRSVDGRFGPVLGRSVIYGDGSARRGRRSVRRTVVGALAALVVVGASACSSDKLADATTASAASAETAAAAFEADGVVADARAASPSPIATQTVGVGSFPADRKIIATADVSIRARNVETAAARLRSSVTTAGGYVETEQTVTSTDPMPVDEAKLSSVTSITMRLRVPTARFDGLLKQMNSLGVVTQRSIGAQDVTSEVVDVDSRVISAKASIARMQVLYEKAVTIADIAAIEGELSRRQADLEALLSRQKELKDQTAMATIGVTLFSDSYRAPVAASSVRKAFDDAAGALGRALRGILIVAAAILPFLVLALLFGFPLVRIVRRRRRSAVAQAPVSSGPSEE